LKKKSNPKTPVANKIEALSSSPQKIYKKIQGNPLDTYGSFRDGVPGFDCRPDWHTQDGSGQFTPFLDKVFFQLP
jgi:hypothetical protein